MTVKKILSPANEFLKKAAKLKQKKYREEFGLFVTEGERSCREAAESGFVVDCIVMTERFFESHEREFAGFNRIVTTDKLFMTLCDTKTPQGVLAVVKVPEERELTGNRYIYCDGIQDPGNAGTIIRSADAFGFSGVIFSAGSVDVFSPKVIRASMGSVFHIELKTLAGAEFLEQAKQGGYFITASALHGKSVDIHNMTVLKKQIFVIGNEGNGVSKEILKQSDEIVHIPMSGAAESLNAGVAASILMFEVSKHE